MLFQWCEIGPLADRRLPAASARRLAAQARHHLLWRRDRRYGT
ncbi:hypothetical protein JOE57_001409 [Microlunatus panaciterrae]|uniref:Uncharacterized protein n=1 Tax=Microlunatus panaciterrae TaxID=400768 RepID=A0ABS2RIE1_9ACTN|nr:hypothetical protein [Microlunatus panaciterrae]